MTRRGYQVYDRDGFPVDDHVVPDGGHVVVPLFMMDSTQKAVARDARRKKTVQRDPFGRVRSTFEEEEEEDAMTIDAQLSYHRPGYRYATDASVNDDEAVKAYNDSVREMCNAWKKRDAQPPPGVPNGESNSNSDAVPRTMDAATAQRIKDAAWAESVRELENAWRGQKR